MSTPFDQAMSQLRETQTAYKSARLQVWKAAELEHSEVVGSIRDLGWQDSQAADWFCEFQPRPRR